MKKGFCVLTAVLTLGCALAATACGGGQESGGEDTPYLTAQNISSLKGKTVGVAQLANVPGLTLQVVLNKYGVDYQIIDSVQAEKSADKVNLVAMDAASITPASGCDYYLCPEPAYTAKINGTKDKPVSFTDAGSLQELYGGEEGYPQAVLVAKKQIAGDSVTGNLVQTLGNSETYLAGVTNESGKIQTVLSLLDGVRTQGLAPAFNKNNFNQAVVANCSVKYTPVSACKDRVNGFLNELCAVNANAAATVSDEFYYTGTFETAAAEGVRAVYVPDGAPALSVVELIERNLTSFDVKVIDASTVQSKVTGENPEADYCILPLNAASKLLGTGNVYQMLGTVTNGNLYFLRVKNS